MLHKNNSLREKAQRNHKTKKKPENQFKNKKILLRIHKLDNNTNELGRKLKGKHLKRKKHFNVSSTSNHMLHTHFSMTKIKQTIFKKHEMTMMKKLGWNQPRLLI